MGAGDFSGAINTMKDSITTTAEFAKSVNNYVNTSVDVITDIAAVLDPERIPIPKMAKNIYAYFVIKYPGANHIVLGEMLSEIKNILKYYPSASDVIFIKNDSAKYGVYPIASGGMYYNKYSTASREEIYRLEKSLKHWTLITCDKDVRLLKKRIELMEIGKVYSKSEIDAEVDEYRRLMQHLRRNDDEVVYQAILDIAVSLAK